MVQRLKSARRKFGFTNKPAPLRNHLYGLTLGMASCLFLLPWQTANAQVVISGNTATGSGVLSAGFGTITDPIDSQSFIGFCQWLLAPTLHPGDLVVMDNLSSHRSFTAVQAIEAVGAEVVYLPPYSPDLNPIGNISSKVKQLIGACKPRSLEQIVEALCQVLPNITSNDLQATFLHCGYAAA